MSWRGDCTSIDLASSPRTSLMARCNGSIFGFVFSCSKSPFMLSKNEIVSSSCFWTSCRLPRMVNTVVKCPNSLLNRPCLELLTPDCCYSHSTFSCRVSVLETSRLSSRQLSSTRRREETCKGGGTIHRRPRISYNAESLHLIVAAKSFARFRLCLFPFDMSHLIRQLYIMSCFILYDSLHQCEKCSANQ